MKYTTLVILFSVYLCAGAQQIDSTATFNVQKKQGLYFPSIDIPTGYTLIACKVIISRAGDLFQKFCTWDDVPGAMNFYWQNGIQGNKVYFEQIEVMKDGVKFKLPPQSAIIRYR